MPDATHAPVRHMEVALHEDYMATLPSTGVIACSSESVFQYMHPTDNVNEEPQSCKRQSAGVCYP